MDLLVTIVIREITRDAGWTVELHIGGAVVPTGIIAPTSVACARLLADRLAGMAPR